jgi:hypothetical protein
MSRLSLSWLPSKGPLLALARAARAAGWSARGLFLFLGLSAVRARTAPKLRETMLETPKHTNKQKGALEFFQLVNFHGHSPEGNNKQ